MLIIGQIQNPIILGENKVLTVNLTDLIVDDPDYPDGSGKDWSIEAYPGSNYTIDTDSGEVTYLYIIPTTNFKGNLLIPVRVNDGISNSNWYNLTVSVVEIPVIVSQKSFPKVYISSYLTISLANLNVQTSKNYPENFKMLVSNGNKFEIVSSTDTTAKIKIIGSLSENSRQIPLKVNDGLISSETYNFIVNVVQTPAGSKPQTFNVNFSQSTNIRRNF